MALGGVDREAGSLNCCEESHWTTNIWAVPSAPLPNAVPCVDDLTRSQRIVSGFAIAIAVGLLAACGYRLFTGLDLWQWWGALACVGGIAAAGFWVGVGPWG